MEQVVDVEPDLVLAGHNFTPPADIDRMRDSGIPVVVVYAETVDEVLADIELIGAAIGADAEADGRDADMQARIDRGPPPRSPTSRPPQRLLRDRLPDPRSTARRRLVHRRHGRARRRRADHDRRPERRSSIPLERLVDADPEVIVLGDAALRRLPRQRRRRVPAGTR